MSSSTKEISTSGACVAGPIREVLDRYTLCDASPDINLANAMTPQDALAITHDQHQRLVFTAEAGNVTPAALEDDIEAICAASPDPGLADVCATLPGPDCPDIGYIFSDAQAALLAEALNELYGIAP